MKWAIYLLSILAAVVIATPSLPGEVTLQPAQSARARQAPPETAPVMLGGTAVLSVPAFHYLSAQERAAGISQRLAKMAEDPAIGTDAIKSVDTDVSTDIVAGDRIIMLVADTDIGAAGVGRQQLADEYAEKIRAAVKGYRQARTPKTIWQGITRTMVATVVLICAPLLLRKLFGRLQRSVEGREKLSVTFQKFEVLHSEQVRRLLIVAIRSARLVIFLVIFYFYLHFTLSSFPWTRPLSGQLLQYLMVPLATMEASLFHYIPNLIFLVVLILITHYLLKFMRLFAQEVEKGSITFSGFYTEWAKPTFKIARFVVIAFVAVVAFPYLPGSQSPAFKGISIFLGVLISLGSSSTVSNIIAGLDLTYRRAFLKGDWIKIGDFIGEVTKMRLLVTHLRTFKNEEVVVPNAVILNSHVVNYSSSAREGALIIHTAITIGYSTPWRQVHSLLLRAAGRTPGILHDPAPFVLQTALNDFYVGYELNAYTDAPQQMPVIYSDLHMNIQDEFNEFGVQIMSPHYMLDPRSAAVVPKSRWYEPPAEPTAKEPPPRP